MWDIKLKLRDTDNNSMVVSRGKEVKRVVNGKGTKYMVTEDDLTLGNGHMMKYTDHVLEMPINK